MAHTRGGGIVKGEYMTTQTETNIRNSINAIISDMMDRIMNKVLIEDPFLPEKHHAAKPLYAALVPDEIFKGAHFERRFVTPFGNTWEKLAMVVAHEYHGGCEHGKTIHGLISEERLHRINEILIQLEHKSGQKVKRKPNWNEELDYILEGKGKLLPVDVTCDIVVHNLKENKSYAFEIKAPLPNSDQTKVSKEKMFKLLAMEPRLVDNAYYALPYNPYGKKEDYAWSFPKRWFNMTEDPTVLIGDEFWNMLGGKGAYDIFIDEINKLGVYYRDRIYREFLCIEPPESNKYSL